MALIFVSIVMTLSTSWFIQTQISIHRTEQMLASSQATLCAEGVLSWAMTALKSNTDCPKIMPRDELMPISGVISGRIDKYTPIIQENAGIIRQKYAMASSHSDYYLLRADVRNGNHHLILYSLLHRKIVNGVTQIAVVWQNRGVD